MKRGLCLLLAAAMLLSMAACTGTEKDWQEQYDLGMRYLEEGDYEEAILAFSAAIDIDDSRPEAYMARAEAYVAIGDPEQALKDYKKAQRISKNNDDYEDLVDELKDLIEELEEIVDKMHDVGPTDTDTVEPLTLVESYNSSGVIMNRYLMSYNEKGLLSQLISETYDTSGLLYGTYVTKFYYDDGNRLTHATYGDTGELYCNYDADGRLLDTSYVDGGWSGTVYEYNEHGVLVQSIADTQVSQTITNYTCDERGNVVEAHSVNTHEYGTSEAWAYYTYDDLGKLTGKTEQWAEGTHYTAYTYLEGIIVEELTFDYTPETDYYFRIQDVAGNSLWGHSVMEGTYTVDEKNRVTEARGYGYDMEGVTEITLYFHYGNEEEGQNTTENNEPTTQKSDAAVIADLNGLLTGVQVNEHETNVAEWSESNIVHTIYRKLVDDYMYQGEGSPMRRMGLVWSEEDGFLHFGLDQARKLTKNAFGVNFPNSTGTDLMNISGNELLVSIGAMEYQQLLVQDFVREGDVLTAVGSAIYANDAGRGFLSYFRATFRENPDCIYGYTLLSLEVIDENQNFGILTASASSVLQDYGSYYATNALDGRLDTAWVEGVDGVGVNEWILLQTTDGSKLEVAVIDFALGYHKSGSLMEKNGWPWKVRIECEGGYQQIVEFLYPGDVAVLDKPVETSWVKITILGAEAGTHYDDTCISEIRLRGLDTDNLGQNTAEDPYQQYKDFFYANYTSEDIVYLADVNHDGMEDMVVVNFSDAAHSEVYGHVYTIRYGTVTEIHSKRGSDYHAGGFFAWYLVPVPDSDYWNLAEESFGMWQGMGTVTYSEYLLTEEGYVIECNHLELDSTAEGNHDEYGMVTEAAWNAYVTALNKELANCYRIYCSSSNGSGSRSLNTSPTAVFGN